VNIGGNRRGQHEGEIVAARLPHPELKHATGCRKGHADLADRIVKPRALTGVNAAASVELAADGQFFGGVNNRAIKGWVPNGRLDQGERRSRAVA